MRDNQEIMLKFVKIVKTFPDVYDWSKGYRSRCDSEKAWDRIAAKVRTEINEECTAEELKVKWKGIRSSFTRFKKRLRERDFQMNPCRKYYLYDELRFLDKFTEPIGVENSGTLSPLSFDENGYYVEVDGSNSIEIVNNIGEWDEHDVKPDITQIDNGIKPFTESESLDSIKEPRTCEPIKALKRKIDYKDDAKREDNEDMQFFKSILPDIKDFTSKEKRKLKKSILQLIDEIEDERKQSKSGNEVSSS